MRKGNGFAWIGDIPAAQKLLEEQVRFNYEKALGQLSGQVNPALRRIVGDWKVDYDWSLEESEWATDLLFKSEGELSRLYPSLLRHGMQSLGRRDAPRFLGQKVPASGGIDQAFMPAQRIWSCRSFGREKHARCRDSARHGGTAFDAWLPPALS
jgi:hypothetical protein